MTAFQTAMFVVGCVFTVLTCAGVVVVGVGVISAKLRDDLEPETLGSAYRKGYLKGRLDAESERRTAAFDEAERRTALQGSSTFSTTHEGPRPELALSSTPNEETTLT